MDTSPGSSQRERNPDRPPPSAAATAKLVRRAQHSDTDAFARLYDANIRPVSRYIAAILKDVDSAEDVAAQTFLLAWQYLPELRNPDQFDAWLFRIAHNQALNTIRQRRPHTPLENAPEVTDTSPFNSPTRRADDDLTRHHLRAALLQLSHLHREVLVLRFLGERTHAEICIIASSRSSAGVASKPAKRAASYNVPEP